MSSVAAKIYSQQTFSFFPHTSISGDVWSVVAKGTTTGAGDAGGTTIVDTNGDSGGADTYNGRWWVRILSGACVGMSKRIVDDDGAGTLTLEGIGFPAQIGAAVNYEILLSPEPVVVVDASGGETDMVDAVRAEPLNRAAKSWIGYWAVPITGARRGKVALITDFTLASGTFVLAAGLGGALAAGDVVLLRRFHEVADLNVGGLTEAYTARLQNRKDFAKGDGVVGPRAGTISFKSQIIPSGSLSAAGVSANQSILGDLLAACGLVPTPDASVAIDAGSTTTSVKVLATNWEKFSIGGMVVVNGNPRIITSLTDGGVGVDSIGVYPALPVAPVAGGVLYASRMYAKSITGDTNACGFEVEIDGIRYTVTGCKGTVVLGAEPVPTLTFTFQADHWVREYEPAPYSLATTYVTAKPVLESGIVAYLDGATADIGGLTATPGSAMVAKSVQGAKGINGRVGYHLSGYNCGATFRELLLSGGELLRDATWLARTSRDLIVFWGSHGSTFGLRIPVARLISDPVPSNASGLVDAPNVLEAQDAGSTTDGGGAYAKVPDFAFFLT